jgi:phage gpG-like protein
MTNAKLPQFQKGLDYFKSKVVQSILPPRIGAAAQRHFTMSFRNQGFTDQGLRRWIPSKGAKANRTLKKSQALANSIRIAEATAQRITITAGNQHVPYAQIHNEGGWIRGQKTVRAHIRGPFKRRRGSRTEEVRKHAVRRHQAKVNMYIRQRRFMGRSTMLNLEIARVINVTINETRKTIFGL